MQLFSNPRGTNEGRKLVTQRRLTTDANGNALFCARLRRGTTGAGQLITATATNDSTGNTSEFSAAKTVGQ